MVTCFHMATRIHVYTCALNVVQPVVVIYYVTHMWYEK